MFTSLFIFGFLFDLGRSVPALFLITITSFFLVFLALLVSGTPRPAPASGSLLFLHFPLSFRVSVPTY